MSVALAPAPARHKPLGRAVKVARIQTVNLPIQLGMPWLILGIAFAVNLVIFALVPDPPAGEPKVTGAILSIYVFMLIAHLQSMTQVFPFALGLSVTRRDFFAGTSLLIVAQSLVQGILLTILLAVERATGGWGMDLHFFGVPFLVQDDWFLQVVAYTVPFLLVSFASIFVGTLYKRWGQLGMYVLSIGSLVLGGVAVVIITWQQAWGAVGRFFADTSAFMLLAGYPLVLSVLLAAAGYLVLRRATP
ncbi:hypothetical protein [Pseudonocardia sp.]|jgi:hypothetical protein|uniref:hypothetical protein n=1 Tax=Pseudonocardia sp. TaxID=60912 RepID=UPI0031FCFE6F